MGRFVGGGEGRRPGGVERVAAVDADAVRADVGGRPAVLRPGRGPADAAAGRRPQGEAGAEGAGTTLKNNIVDLSPIVVGDSFSGDAIQPGGLWMCGLGGNGVTTDVEIDRVNGV